MRTVLIIFLLMFGLSAVAFVESPAGTFTTDGTLSDTQAAVDAASDGGIVVLPNNDALVWAGTLTIAGKGIKLMGGGSGRVVARSVGANTVGTGSKTFSVNAAGLAMTAGQTLRITVLGGVRDINGAGTGVTPWMEGTVTTYSGTTLTMNITSVNSSGTYNLWIISSNAVTGVYHNHATLPLIEITEDVSHNVELTGFRVGLAVASPRRVRITANSGKPVLIHDMWFDAWGPGICIESASNRGIVWDCSFVVVVAGTTSSEGFKFSTGNTWNSASTMGTADTTGLNNFYVEDCDFHAFLTSFDVDENGRVVVRHCLFNQASMGGSHGPDSSNWGVRHLEIYKNECVFNAIGGSPDLETMNIDKWILLRGGTGIIASNALPNFNSQAWGDGLEIKLACWQLRFNGGPNGCWGANNPGIQYPSPRQIGMGYVTGAAGNDSVGYVGDLEPLYIWGNTGSPAVAPSDYVPNVYCTSPDSAADYIIAGRDYYNNETAKPSWVPYAYPHPQRTVSSSPAATFSAALRGTVRLSGPVKLQ